MNDVTETATNSTRKRVMLVVKYMGALGILAFVLKQAELGQVVAHMRTMPLWLAALAFATFTIAQICSTWRMNYYYRSVGKHIDGRYSIILYYVSLFYNIILPGGIGGDAYKVYLLRKQVGWPVGEGVRIQLANRANGLLVLMLLMFATLFFMNFGEQAFLAHIMTLAMMLLTVLGYFVCAKLFLKELPKVAMGAIPYSLGVQGFTVLTMCIIWYALGGRADPAEYVFLFMLAAIAGMLPITIGGLGIREFTFFYGSHYLKTYTGADMDPEFGVAISLVLFGITVLSALLGLPYMHRVGRMNPLAKAA